MSRMTIDDLSDVLGGYVPGGLTFLGATNQIVARWFDEGMYEGLAAKVVFANGTSTGIINLPRAYEALMGLACENSIPVPVYGQFREWRELGLGWVEPSDMNVVGVIDMGDGWPTTVDIATEGTLRFKILNAADAGKTIRIQGLGTVNGTANRVVYDATGGLGVTATTANPTVDFTQTFSSLAPPYGSIQIPDTMVGYSQLYVVNGGVETLLATFEPGETRPCYRRYKTGIVENTDIITFCKLRFLPYRDDTDVVLPTNIGALKFGLLALQKEDALAIDEAEQMWAKSRQLLQKQLKAFRGSAKPAFSILGAQAMLTSPRSVY